MNIYGCLPQATSKCQGAGMNYLKCGSNACNPNMYCCPTNKEDDGSIGNCYLTYSGCTSDTPSPETACNDGEDNDCDGYIDCGDIADCSADFSCQGFSPCPGEVACDSYSSSNPRDCKSPPVTYTGVDHPNACCKTYTHTATSGLVSYCCYYADENKPPCSDGTLSCGPSGWTCSTTPPVECTSDERCSGYDSSTLGTHTKMVCECPSGPPTCSKTGTSYSCVPKGSCLSTPSGDCAPGYCCLRDGPSVSSECFSHPATYPYNSQWLCAQ
jgi:hypothetical protein